MTSIAPLRVAGLMEFQVFETEPLMLRTYCILQAQQGGVSLEKVEYIREKAIEKRDLFSKSHHTGGSRRGVRGG